MDIKVVGVVGAGTMGNGIAQVFAQAGFDVRLVDVAQPMLDRARGTIEKSLAKFVEKGKLPRPTATPRSAACRPTTSLDRLADADYVVEAIVENVDAKRELFASLDAITKPRRRSSRRTRRRSRSPRSAPRRSGRTECSACTS